MKEFRVEIPVSSTTTFMVEAEDKEEAVEQAFEQLNSFLCCSCSDVLDELLDSDEPEVTEIPSKKGDDNV